MALHAFYLWLSWLRQHLWRLVPRLAQLGECRIMTVTMQSTDVSPRNWDNRVSCFAEVSRWLWRIFASSAHFAGTRAASYCHHSRYCLSTTCWFEFLTRLTRRFFLFSLARWFNWSPHSLFIDFTSFMQHNFLITNCKYLWDDLIEALSFALTCHWELIWWIDARDSHCLRETKNWLWRDENLFSLPSISSAFFLFTKHKLIKISFLALNNWNEKWHNRLVRLIRFVSSSETLFQLPTEDIDLHLYRKLLVCSFFCDLKWFSFEFDFNFTLACVVHAHGFARLWEKRFLAVFEASITTRRCDLVKFYWACVLNTLRAKLLAYRMWR